MVCIYKVDNVLSHQSGLPGSGNMLHQFLYVGSYLQQAKAWPIGPSLRLSNAQTTSLFLQGVKGVAVVNLERTTRWYERCCGAHSRPQSRQLQGLSEAHQATIVQDIVVMAATKGSSK